MMGTLRSVALALAGSAAVAATAAAQEKRIERKDLPPAVERTVAAQSRGATIKGFSSEVEDGKTQYEVELTVNGRTRDIIIGATGAILVVEDEVAFAGLPAAVKAGLTAQAGSGRITLVETLTKHGKLVAYEAQVTAADGKKTEVQVGPDGKKLAHEE